MHRESTIMVPINTSVDVDVEVEIDENVEISKSVLVEAIQSEPDVLKELGFMPLPKNMSMIDDMKLELFMGILDKCTLDQLEKFKATL